MIKYENTIFDPKEVQYAHAYYNAVCITFRNGAEERINCLSNEYAKGLVNAIFEATKDNGN